MERAVAWYHERLLAAPDAGPARDYLRSRGYDGDVVRQFRLGWAPDDWDALAKALKLPEKVLLGLGSRLRQPARPGPGLLPRPRAVPDLRPVGAARSRWAGASCRHDPGRRHRSGQSRSTRTRRSRRSIRSAARSTRSTGPSRASSRRARSSCARGTPTSSGASRPACRGRWRRAAPRWPRSTSRCCATSPSASCSPTTPDAAGQSATSRVYEWERKHEVDVVVADLPGGSDPGDLARDRPRRAGQGDQGGAALPPVPRRPHARAPATSRRPRDAPGRPRRH